MLVNPTHFASGQPFCQTPSAPCLGQLSRSWSPWVHPPFELCLLLSPRRCHLTPELPPWASWPQPKACGFLPHQGTCTNKCLCRWVCWQVVWPQPYRTPFILHAKLISLMWKLSSSPVTLLSHLANRARIGTVTGVALWQGLWHLLGLVCSASLNYPV